MSTCDIIIPTFNGKQKLECTIPALLEQFIPPGWSVRIIMSDDGSQERLPDLLTSYAWAKPWDTPLVLRHAHVGRSHARNIAINHATADILLFLADDMVLRPYALSEHLLFHAKHKDANRAALGCVLWDPRVHPTPFMEWMMHGGQQNDYDSLLGVLTCSPKHYFYGSFISMKRDFLGASRFSDTFSAYGWEDLELGARLQDRGLILHVLHDARALHHHAYDADAILRRQRIVGSAKYLVNTNSIRRSIHTLYGVLGLRAIMLYIMQKWGDRLNIPHIFARVSAGEFWYGVHHANKLLKSDLSDNSFT